MSEARLKLHAKKEVVDIGRIGIQGGVYTGFTTIDVRSLEDAVVRYGVAQALLDGIASTEEGLAVRDILVDKDFQDKNAVAITNREWRQPWSGSYNATEQEVQIYQTNKNTDNFLKVMIIYGVRATQTGPGRTTCALNIASISFKRASVKTIDIWQIELLDTVPDSVVYARTPLLYKKGDYARIDFWPKGQGNSGLGSGGSGATGASGGYDNLILLGKTIEAIGLNVTG